MSFDPRLTRSFARFAAIAVVAVGASACSSIPNWADPTGWIGGSDQTTAVDAGNSNEQTPDLASIPDKPTAPSTADERKQVAEDLEADRSNAQYSADSLRGGTEPSAAPPPDAPIEAPSASAQNGGEASAQTTSADQPAAANDAQAASVSPAPTPAPAAAVENSPDEPPAPPAAPDSAAQVVATTPATTETSAAPAAPNGDQLGFQPSKAPALDPSVARFVPKAVLQRFDQTSGNISSASPLTPPTPPKPDAKQTSSAIDPQPPEERAMRHASATGDPTVSPSRPGMLTQAAYTQGAQSSPRTVVFFAHDSAVLSSQAKSQILAVAAAFRSRGDGGFVHVVGHSSSRTAEMPMARHLDVVFERSQSYATSVAHELIRDGVPADKILIEAVGDSQPIYYESMPQGEAGNRRAEIFL